MEERRWKLYLTMPHPDKPKPEPRQFLSTWAWLMSPEIMVTVCHGYNTCQLESFHHSRCRLTPKSSYHWTSFRGRCQASALMWNHDLKRTVERLFVRLKLPHDTVTPEWKEIQRIHDKGLQKAERRRTMDALRRRAARRLELEQKKALSKHVAREKENARKREEAALKRREKEGEANNENNELQKQDANARDHQEQKKERQQPKSAKGGAARPSNASLPLHDITNTINTQQQRNDNPTTENVDDNGVDMSARQLTAAKPLPGKKRKRSSTKARYKSRHEKERDGLSSLYGGLR